MHLVRGLPVVDLQGMLVERAQAGAGDGEKGCSGMISP